MQKKSPDFFDDLRIRFLSEGQESSRMLLQTAPDALDLATDPQIVHSWAGIGAMLGCSQITMQARIIEQLIREPYEGSRQQIWDALSISYQFFTRNLPNHSRSNAIEVLS